MAVLRICPICLSGESVPVAYLPSPVRPMYVVACQGCGLVFVNPMYTPAEKDAAEPQRAMHRSRSSELSEKAAFAHSLRRMRRCLDMLLPHLKPGQRVLEIGCGDGALLSLLKDLGTCPTGLDMDEESAAAIRQSLSVPVLTGSFEEAELGDQQFDAIILVHLIEHFFEPVAMLRKVRQHLRPGGMVFLETPNILRPKVGPRRVFSFAHNYHFEPRTLALALYRAGFRCSALREFRRDSFQIVAHAADEPDLGKPPSVHPWQTVHKVIRRHRVRYLTRLQFLWRKVPRLKDWLLYCSHRQLAGPALQQWLTAPSKPARL